MKEKEILEAKAKIEEGIRLINEGMEINKHGYKTVIGIETNKTNTEIDGYLSV